MIEMKDSGAQPQRQQAAQNLTGDFFTTLRGIGGGLVAQGIGGEYYSKFRETTEKIASDLILRGVEMNIIGLTRQEYDNLRFSTMVLVFSLSDVENVVAYHTLILEATGEKLKPEIRNIDNQQVRVNYVTGDANDTALADLVSRAVQENWPNASAYANGATVVPDTIDASSLDQVTNIIRNAAVAGVSAVQTVSGNTNPVALNTIQRDTSLVLDMVTGNACCYDAVGNPQRSSISVSVSVRRKNRMQADPSVVNAPGDTIKICDVSGFVNPIWAPIGQGVDGFGYINPQAQVPQGKLVAEYVITGVHTPYAQSPSAVALALASVLLVSDNNNWVQGLIPKSFGQKNDATDLGALNVICNIGNETNNGMWGSVVDTEGMGNDLVKFNKYVGQLFRPGTIISIDCPESAPQSWYLNIFAAAAMGDGSAAAAVAEAFDELTDGNFSRFFPEGGSLFNNVTRIPMGYYLDGNKTKRDIRDVDLVMVANAFRSNPENIHAYNDTWVSRPNSGPITNLAKREGIIGHILREQYAITGYAMRCTFSADTITALSKALQCVKVNTVVNTPLSVDALRTGTPAPDYVSGSLVSTGQTYMNSGAVVGRPGMAFNPNQFGFNRR